MTLYLYEGGNGDFYQSEQAVGEQDVFVSFCWFGFW